MIENERAIYLIFDTDEKHLQQTETELEKLRVLVSGYWTYTLQSSISKAHDAALKLLKDRKKEGD